MAIDEKIIDTIRTQCGRYQVVIDKKLKNGYFSGLAKYIASEKPDLVLRSTWTETGECCTLPMLNLERAIGNGKNS